jgi:hypothetical protein
MPTVRAEVITHLPGDVPADFATNTVFHTIGDGVFDPSTGYQNHADELKTLFSGADPTHGLFAQYKFRDIEVKVYDLADPLPRPIRATSTFTPGAPDAPADLGPRQVALVLSFYGTRNLVSQRGHIYIGPLDHGVMDGPTPSTDLLGQVLDLGHGLFDIGGENVAHVVRSRKLESNTVVANYWVDNRWDTQRRRLPKASTRVAVAP